MSHAAYVYDIEHVIVDNLQFMTSYLRYVLTPASCILFPLYFLPSKPVAGPKMRCTALLKSTVWKRVAAVERGSIGAHWSSSCYTFSLEASLPTAIVWIIISHPFVISKIANANRACNFGESTMSLTFFPAIAAPSSQITCVLFLLNLVFATALLPQNLKQAALLLQLEFAPNPKF